MLSVIYAECHLCWVSFMLSVIYAESHLCWVSFMLSLIYAECHLCWVSFMLSVIYAECHLCQVSFMLSVIYAECHLCQVSFMPIVIYIVDLWLVVRSKMSLWEKQMCWCNCGSNILIDIIHPAYCFAFLLCVYANLLIFVLTHLPLFRHCLSHILSICFSVS